MKRLFTKIGLPFPEDDLAAEIGWAFMVMFPILIVGVFVIIPIAFMIKIAFGYK